MAGNTSGASQRQRWQGELDLRFTRLANRTILCDRRHRGPLRIQKPLYPEGPEVCHVVLIHPPGGIADRDDLLIHLNLQPAAQVVITTPGATKWYKAKEGSTFQVEIDVQAGATLEWLPNENIYFSHASARMNFRVRLAKDAATCGWDIHMLGRIASGERWKAGAVRSNIEFVRDNGSPIWSERTSLQAKSDLLRAEQGLADYPVFGTFWCLGPVIEAHFVEALAAILPLTASLKAGASLLPENVLLVRAVGNKIEPVRSLMIDCWSRTRPLIIGREAKALRLWST
jgi:urease accessory protein